MCAVRRMVSGLFVVGCFCTAIGAQKSGEPFEAHTFVGAGKLTMPYRLFVPAASARTKPLPLVVYLHGASGLGTDNLQQISTGGNEISSRFWVRPEIQTRFPAFVVAPQRSTAETSDAFTQLVLELVEKLSAEHSIDRNRLYIVGQSMGAVALWDIISTRPDLFAAAMPSCGRGDPAKIAAAKNVKVWAFVGAEDAITVVRGMRTTVAALRRAGGTVRFTEYPKVGHDVWVQVVKEPDLAPWLFAQSRR